MKKQSISNWGNYPQIEAEVFEPAFVQEVNDLVKKEHSILARGNGRCYGDVALSKKIISTLALNKVLAFDKVSGIIKCQSGILLSDILKITVPHGFFLPVTPGTKFITLGGALASDVHGKNHTENAETFWDTVGGMGRTGVITEVCFQLKKIETSYIASRNIKVKNLDEMLALFDQSGDTTYSVAWMDCLKKGANQGRGILMLGEHATLAQLDTKKKKNPLALPKKTNLNVPLFFPGWVLNKFAVKAFNFLFYNKQRKKVSTQIIDYDNFFYPLDAILNWNRIYGKKGFTQYQFVLPKKDGKAGLKEILDTISNAGEGSFLVVLKLFGKTEPLAKWSFPMEGYTLAPYRSHTYFTVGRYCTTIRR